MAYVQITTRCNFHCEHCCYACTMDGEDMSPEVFAAALKLCEEEDQHIDIGGGEPTLHPEFWHFLIDAIASDCEYVWLATNGSITKTAIKLAKLAQKGVIGCDLSQDFYHDPIDIEVIHAFTVGKEPRHFGYGDDQITKDMREIRDVFKNEDRTAPWRDPEEGGDPNNCPCEGLIIKPNGDIHQCGCLNSPKIGDVFNGYEYLKDEYGDDIYECWQQSASYKGNECNEAA